MPSTYKSSCPPGAVLDYSASAVANGNFLAADGSLLLVADYPDLFNAISNVWGGDGVTDFRLPDSRGKDTLGSGTGAGLTARSVGQTGGNETHQLSSSEMPSHTHRINQGAGHGGFTKHLGQFATSLNGPFALDSTGVESTGSNSDHNNMQPFIVFTKMIKV